MISLARILKLRNLEIFQVIRNGRVLACSIIEDTRNPFTEEDKKRILYALWMKRILVRF